METLAMQLSKRQFLGFSGLSRDGHDLSAAAADAKAKTKFAVTDRQMPRGSKQLSPAAYQACCVRKAPRHLIPARSTRKSGAGTYRLCRLQPEPLFSSEDQV